MRRSSCVIALAVIVALAPAAFADTYSIDFTVASGSPAPGAGSFTYNASAPLGSQFTNFVVNWYGFSIDLTSTANNPFVAGTGCGTTATSATSFALLSGSALCSPDEGSEWAAEAVNPGPGGFAIFEFVDTGLSTPPDFDSEDVELFATAGSGSGGSVTAVAFGTWTITDTTNSAVPEPRSLILMTAALLPMAFLIRRRNAQVF